jgi:hypothetical protein
VEDAIRCAGTLGKHDLYAGVGLSRQDYGLKQRCLSEDIAGIAGVWADIDVRSDAHPKPTLPANIEEALSILPPEFPPSIVVCTGNGVHIWWLFREPWIFESADERGAAATLISWLAYLHAYEVSNDLAGIGRRPRRTSYNAGGDRCRPSSVWTGSI